MLEERKIMKPDGILLCAADYTTRQILCPQQKYKGKRESKIQRHRQTERQCSSLETTENKTHILQIIKYTFDAKNKYRFRRDRGQVIILVNKKRKQ